MRQSCFSKKVSPQNSHMKPGLIAFTASLNLNTFFTFLTGFSFNFINLSETDSTNFASGSVEITLLNLKHADSCFDGVGGGGGGSSGLGHDLLEFWAAFAWSLVIFHWVRSISFSSLCFLLICLSKEDSVFENTPQYLHRAKGP